MGAIADKILEALNIKFNISLAQEKIFFDKPVSLEALNSAVVIALKSFSTQLSSKLRGLVDFDITDLSALKNFIKSDPELNGLFLNANNELDDGIVAYLFLQCEILKDSTIVDETLKQQALDKLQGVNFLGSNLEKLSDFINDLETKLASLADSLSPYIGIALFLYYIIQLAIDLFTNTRFHSPYRTKYIQKLIKMALDMMKDIVNEQVDALKTMFSGIDELLITMTIATGLYLYNRSQLQKQSTEQLAENLCEDLGLNPFEDIVIDVSTNVIDLSQLPLICNKEDDDVVIPKEPIENKIANFSCEIDIEEETEELNAIIKEDISSKAIIINETENVFKYEVNIGDKVTDRTIIATLSGDPIYSPLNGKVVSLFDSSIVLSDISESSDAYLTQTIKELNAAYQEQNEIKMFVKDWQVKSLYPVLLAKHKAGNSGGLAFAKNVESIKKYWNDEILKSYDKNIKKITGEDNVKKNAENESLHIIQEEVNTEEKIVNKYLRSIEYNATRAKVAKPKKEDFVLIEYYIVELTAALNSIKDPSGLTLEYRDQINIFTDQRYVLDGWKPEDIKEKGNDYIKELEKGITIGDWFQKGLDIYAEDKKLSDVKDWLEDIKNPNKLENYEKTELISKLMYLYEFYLDIKTKNEEYKDLKEADNKKQVVKEGNYISNFFGNLWKRFDALPDEIAELEQRLEGLALFTGYSITEIEGEDYRSYLISDKTGCKGPDRDPNLGGSTETDLGSIKYWLKYCSFATLVGLNPLTWSTGFILPTGPLLLPTVYIPIKPITTSYGFIVLGLTITGIWVFPMVLMVNYSTNYSLPIADPATFIRNQISALKTEISGQLSDFKKDALVNFADKIKVNVNELNIEVEGAEAAIKNHRLGKPPKTKKFDQEQINWNTANVSLKEQRTEIKLKRWTEEKKYKIVYEAATLGTTTGSGSEDAGISKIQQTEDLILKQFDKLDVLADKADKIVAPLPITLQPETANFGITLKNPKPIINIASEIDDNINPIPLEKITNRFRLDNEKLMTKGGEAFDYKKYLSVIKVAMPTLIKKDPFPAYENLGLLNIPYLTFLAKDFTVSGSQTYGMPGFPPFPIG